MKKTNSTKVKCVECQKTYDESQIERKFSPIILCLVCYKNMVQMELDLRKNAEPDDFQFIIDNVFLGSENSGFEMHKLKKSNIKHFLVIAHKPYLKFKDSKEIEYKGKKKFINSSTS